MKSSRWSREETILVLDLYCRIPFGRCSHTTPEVQSLAAKLGRTSSAVAMKLVNFAALDPTHAARGVRGLSHTSKLDRQVWKEAHADWNAFFDTTLGLAEAREDMRDSADATPEPTEFDWDSRVGSNATSIRSARLGQQFFRKMILAGYESTCCVTGINKPELLVASHIIPWSDDPKRRLDPRNGLCLMTLFDRAFDRGLMTITPTYKVQFSNRLKGKLAAEPYEQFFHPYEGRKINLPERWAPDPALLSLHRVQYYN